MILRRSPVLGAAVFVLAFICYANTLGHAFVWDDVALVPDNPRIRTLDWKTVEYLFKTDFWQGDGTAGGLYRPLVRLSYHIDYQFYGLNAGRYHLTNVLYHAGVSLLSFLLVMMLLRQRWLALMTGLMFATLPLHTENVAWVAGRSDLMAMFWMLATLVTFVQWRRSGVTYLAVSIVCFVCALLSKEVAMMAPLLVFALAAGPFGLCGEGRGRWRRTIVALLPYGIAVVLFALVRAHVLGEGAAAFQRLTSGPGQAIALTLSLVGRYLVTLLFPFKLNAELEYPIPPTISDPAVLFGAAVAGALIYAFVRYRHRAPYVMGFSFLFVGLLPVIHIIPMPETSAERFLYVPSLGFSILVAALLSYVANRRRAFSQLVTVLAVAIVAAYAVRTYARNFDWKDETTLYRKTVETAGSSARAHLNLGKVYYGEGRLTEATAEIQRALEIDPKYAGAWSTLAGVYKAQGDMAAAMEAVNRALAIEPNNANFHNSLGVLYIQTQDFKAARRCFRSALAEDPGHGRARFNLALASYMDGDMGEARTHFEEVPFKDTEFPYAYFYLAMIASQQGDRDTAVNNAKKFLAVYDKRDTYRSQAEAILHP